MIKSIKIERYNDVPGAALIISRSPTSPLAHKLFLRYINNDMLIDTHLPEQDQILSGALVTTILDAPKVLNLEIWQTNAGFWFADAFVEVEGQKEFRRGEGSTPVEALNYLILNIQRF